MFEDMALFVTIAEIAGVFVGFAALISVTRRSDIETTQLAQIQAVVTSGLLVVVTALVPVGLDIYGVGGHGLWVASSLVYLVLNWVVIFLALQRATNRELARAQLRNSPIGAVFFWLLELTIQVPLLLIVFGVNPNLDVAFYTTALVFHLFEAAFILAQLVYAQGGRHRAA
jgi:hypothetical protein